MKACAILKIKHKFKGGFLMSHFDSDYGYRCDECGEYDGYHNHNISSRNVMLTKIHLEYSYHMGQKL